MYILGMEIIKEQTEGLLLEYFDHLETINESDPLNIILMFKQLSQGKFNESKCLVCGRKFKKRSPNGQTCGYCGYLRQKVRDKRWFIDTRKDLTNELDIRDVEKDRQMIINHDHSTVLVNGYELSSVCQIPGCKNKVSAYIMKNFSANKHFCIKHNQIRVKCVDCEKLLVLYANEYIQALFDPNWKGPLCSHCSIMRHNYDPKFAKIRKDHLHRYNASEEGKQHNKELLDRNHEIIHNGWSKSKENHAILQKNCENYRNSDKGKDHMRRQAIANAESYRQSEAFKVHCESLGLRLKECPIHGLVYHNGQFCVECHPESGGVSTSLLWNIFDQQIDCNENCLFAHNECSHALDLKNQWGWCQWYLRSHPNFIERNGVRFYKNFELKSLCKLILSGKIDLSEFPGFNIRFGRVCYHNLDVLDDKIHLLSNSNFVERDGIQYFLHPSSGQYVPWIEYSQSFLDDMNRDKSDSLLHTLIEKEGFVLEPIIGYNSENETWSRAATDKYLYDKGYRWFCYIKLFQSHPFIVGKTGTKGSIYDSGSEKISMIDFDFIVGVGGVEDLPHDGPGRKFIRENYPNIEYTDYDRILCRICDSENEALEVESMIIKKYALFTS